MRIEPQALEEWNELSDYQQSKLAIEKLIALAESHKRLLKAAKVVRDSSGGVHEPIVSLAESVRDLQAAIEEAEKI